MSEDGSMLKSLVARVEKLERAVFRSTEASKGVKRTPSGNNYSGATGGIRLLADEGFFDKKRTFGEVCKALGDKGYHYSRQAVQTPLNALSGAGKPLVALKQGGRKVYATRK